MSADEAGICCPACSVDVGLEGCVTFSVNDVASDSFDFSEILSRFFVSSPRKISMLAAWQ